MKIIYLSSDAIAAHCLTVLAGGPHEIVAVITQPDRPAGRGQKLRPTPIRKLAQELGLKVFGAANANAVEVLSTIRTLRPDILVTFAFNQKLGRELLEAAPHGAINVHPSLLPKYRGAAPVARAILNGDSETGISIIRMVEDLDAGDIYAQEHCLIDPKETTGELEERLGKRAAGLLRGVLEEIEKGTAQTWAQDHERATGAPKIKKSEALLDFSLPAEELVNCIRAFTPWPGAFAFFIGRSSGKAERVIFTSATAVQVELSGVAVDPGTIMQDLLVKCGWGAMSIERIKPAGGKEMSWRDLVNGRDVRPGDRFTSIESQP